MVKKSATPSFEDAIIELEHIVTELEKGDVPLDDALAQFERGIKLVRASQKKLTSAEQKVRILMEQDKEALPVDFEGKED